MDNSEIDDLDNEVQNIARKYQQQRKDDGRKDLMETGSDNLHSELNHEDIKL